MERALQQLDAAVFVVGSAQTICDKTAAALSALLGCSVNQLDGRKSECSIENECDCRSALISFYGRHGAQCLVTVRANTTAGKGQFAATTTFACTTS